MKKIFIKILAVVAVVLVIVIVGINIFIANSREKRCLSCPEVNYPKTSETILLP
jgi:uncharacterized alpha/beta hydrolase family protein